MLVLALQFSRGWRGERPAAEPDGARRRWLLPHNGREDSELEIDPALGSRSSTSHKFDDGLASAPTRDLPRCRRPDDLTFEVQLLRKEVIQPHLPVRLPCYDFTPITDPTFDGSLPRVGPPASGVADFRGVTGGVYKARERIHPGVLIRDY